MKLKRIALGLLATLGVLGSAGWFSLDKETRGLLAALPTDRDLLFWSQPQRDAAFRALDRLPFLARSRVVPAGGAPMPLPPGPPLKLALDVVAWMAGQRSAAVLVLHDGKLRLERYGLGFGSDGRWTSFSVAKSITATLVGAAIRDGHIRRMDDKVSDYIADMKGSAYDDVSIRQLLTMTSGIRWNEDYGDPVSDVARFNNHKPEDGFDALVSYLRKVPREAPAGTRWLYSTGETNLVGILLSEATQKPLSEYLSEKIWTPAGMEQQATWILSRTGRDICGCCIQAATRDFARFGQFILNGARADGHGILPDGWLAEATSERTGIGLPDQGYGYQWWTYADGSFSARGIFGQGILIDSKRRLVVAVNAKSDPARPGQTGENAAQRGDGCSRVRPPPLPTVHPRKLQMIESRALFEIRLQVPEVVDLGDTPLGRRRIAVVAGGTFEGERLKGTVLGAPAGDWLLQRVDGTTALDVRLTLRTDDGELIYMAYRGLRHGPPEVMARLAAGESVDPKTYYFRVAPTFETASTKYDWLNRILAIGIGRRERSGPIYAVHEIL